MAGKDRNRRQESPRAHRGGPAQGAGQGLHERGAARVLQAALVELRDQLLQNADDTGEHLRENEITTDPSDRATLEEEYTLELRTRDRERKLLKKVEKSIRLIDDGSYGCCEETGEPIGVAAAARAAHRDALARGAGAPRARAEDVRRRLIGDAPIARRSTRRRTSVAHRAPARRPPAARSRSDEQDDAWQRSAARSCRCVARGCATTPFDSAVATARLEPTQGNTTAGHGRRSRSAWARSS